MGKLSTKLVAHEKDLEPLYQLGFHGLDSRVKSPASLTYEEAFSLATFVCLTSNLALQAALAPNIPVISEPETLRLQAVSLLQAMSTREALIGFQPQEIAGMVAAMLEIDTVARIVTPGERPTFVVGGMGGDKGLIVGGEQSKLFSTSTLAALALASFGAVHKHHSYPNTSKVAGQSAIEAMGARSDMADTYTMEMALSASGVLMSSCHSVRTLHTISHVLKGETVNHAIGPLAVPHLETDVVNALIGVNHNVHPVTITESLSLLKEKGIQVYGNSVAFCGVAAAIEDIPVEVLNPDAYCANPKLKELVALDEVAPPPYTTMASFLVNGEATVAFFIAPTDFMELEEAESMTLDRLLIPNTPTDIMAANEAVILASDMVKTKYVAMTVALANFTRDYAHLPDALDRNAHRVNPTYLRTCYKAVVESMFSGNTEKTVRLYVEATQKDMLPGIDLVILDIDKTLAHPENPAFYDQYSGAVNEAVGRHLDVNLEEATRVAHFYRNHLGGGEEALFSGTIGEYFPEYGERAPNFELLHDAMARIQPDGQFTDDGITANLVKLLRAKGKKVVAVTDCPESLSRRILDACGLDPDSGFDMYVPFTREDGPPKLVQGEKIFREIAAYFEVPLDRVLSVGDNYFSDIVPAENLGMATCLVSAVIPLAYRGLRATNFKDVFRAYRRSLGGHNE